MSAKIKTVLEVGGVSQFKSAFREMGTAVKTWRGAMGKALAGFRDSVAGLKGGLVGVAAAGLAMRKALGEAGEFEKLTTQFDVLLGSADAARERMEELARFGASTPFELAEVAKASVTLQTLTNGALATRRGLRMVGDLAAGAGQGFEELAVHVGRLYDGLMNGRPVGQSMARLQELGIISGDVRGRIEALQKAGADGAQVWGVAASAFGRFSGMMDKQSGTLFGVLSNLRDQFDALARQMGEPIADALKPVLADLVKNAAAYEQTARRVGESIVGLGALLAEHRKALGAAAAAWLAYRGGMMGKEILAATVTLAKAVWGIGAKTIALAKSRAALAAETAALAKNTAAQVANSAARNVHGFSGTMRRAGGGRHAAAGMSVKEAIASGMATGGKWGKAFGMSAWAAIKIAGSAIGKVLAAVITPAVVGIGAAAAGVAVVVRGWADHQSKVADATMRVHASMNAVLAAAHKEVFAAEDAAGTAAARASLEGRIADLKERAAAAGREDHRTLILQTVESIKLLSAQAEKVRLRKEEAAAARQAAQEAANARFHEEQAAEAAAIAAARGKREEAERAKLAGEVAAKHAELNWKLFDRADAKRQVDLLTGYLQEKLAKATVTENFARRLAGDITSPLTFSGSADIAREADAAMAAGQMNRAARLMALLEETLEIEDKLTAAKKAQAEAQEKSAALAKAQAETAKELAAAEEAKRQATARTGRALEMEIKALELRAAGRADLAAALEDEISAREEAARLAEGTTKTEAEMLAIVKHRNGLRRQLESGAGGAPAGGGAEGSFRRRPGRLEVATGLQGARGLGPSVIDRRARENRPDPATRAAAAAAKYYERTIALQEDALRVWKSLGVA